MFETFSFLPPLTDAEITKQVEYITRNGWTPCLEFAEPSQACECPTPPAPPRAAASAASPALPPCALREDLQTSDLRRLTPRRPAPVPCADVGTDSAIRIGGSAACNYFDNR